MLSWKKRSLALFLPTLFVVGLLHGGSTFSRIKTWISGEVLTASDLNAEFNNILNNFEFSGLDDYSETTTEMRTVTDPYPGSAESQATSGAGELERLRYQILEIKKAIQASNVTYWYQDTPTAGVFTIAASSVGINDTTPSANLDVTGTLNVTGAATFGSASFSTGAGLTFSGPVIFSSTVTFSAKTLVLASTTSAVLTDNGTRTVTFGSETVDALNEFSGGTTFTASYSGNYRACLSGAFALAGGDTYDQVYLEIGNGAGSIVYVQEGFFDTGTTTIPQPAFSACQVINLTAGDTLKAYVGINDTTGSDDTTFTGKFSVERIY